MSVYYRDAQTILYHGDALDVLPRLADGSVHAVVTDPPYVLTTASHHGAKVGGWPDLMNNAVWFTTWYRHVSRLLVDDGSFWTFANWRTIPTVTRAAADAGLHLSALVVWDKQIIGTGGRRGLRSRYELIALLPAPGFRIADRSLPDVWRHPVAFRKPHGHPAEKPAAILDHLLTACRLPPGAVVLDPFAGSGTTLAVAKAAGLSAVGVEADERWCEVTARRLSTPDTRPRPPDPPAQPSVLEVPCGA